MSASYFFCLYIEENKKRSFGLKSVFFFGSRYHLSLFFFVFVKSGMEFGVHFFVGCFLSVIISFYGFGVTDLKTGFVEGDGELKV